VQDSLPARLRAVREASGLNQTDFAALGGVSKRSQIMYEQGKADPAATYLAQLLEQGVDVMFVLTGTPATTTPAGPAVSAADAVQITIELIDELGLQGKLPMEAIRLLTAWVVEQRATKDQARAFLSAGLSIGQSDKDGSARSAQPIPARRRKKHTE
jgi:transcriptional regulator with XRE-family HTH domain